MSEESPFHAEGGVKAVSVDEAAMKNQHGFNGSVQTKTSANKRFDQDECERPTSKQRSTFH